MNFILYEYMSIVEYSYGLLYMYSFIFRTPGYTVKLILIDIPHTCTHERTVKNFFVKLGGPSANF